MQPHNASYGAAPLSTQAAVAAAGAKAAEPPRGKMLTKGPIFLENPDGSIAEAIPSHLKEVRAKGSRAGRDRDRSGADGDSDGSTGSQSSRTAAANMALEVDMLYTRHERVFMVLLSAQFALEVLYAAVFVVRMRPSIIELIAMYNWEISPKVAESVLWFAFGSQVLYGILYYTAAGTALWTKRPLHYQHFANCCLFGVVGLVLLAYVDKFNLPIFFLRLLAYIYARFLQGLTASILLLPPPAQAVLAP